MSDDINNVSDSKRSKNRKSTFDLPLPFNIIKSNNIKFSKQQEEEDSDYKKAALISGNITNGYTTASSDVESKITKIGNFYLRNPLNNNNNNNTKSNKNNFNINSINNKNTNESLEQRMVLLKKKPVSSVISSSFNKSCFIELCDRPFINNPQYNVEYAQEIFKHLFETEVTNFI